MGKNQALHSLQALGDELSTVLSAGLIRVQGPVSQQGESSVPRSWLAASAAKDWGKW